MVKDVVLHVVLYTWKSMLLLTLTLTLTLTLNLTLIQLCPSSPARAAPPCPQRRAGRRGRGVPLGVHAYRHAVFQACS